MPEAFFCYVVETDGFIHTKGQQPRNPHLGAGPEVPADRAPTRLRSPVWCVSDSICTCRATVQNL